VTQEFSSLYSREVREFFRTRDWPSGLIWRVYENDEPAPHLNLVFFRDNWITLTFQAQLKTTEIVKEIMHKMETEGIPTFVGKMEHETDNDDT
jgi:hypothetical protein